MSALRNQIAERFYERNVEPDECNYEANRILRLVADHLIANIEQLRDPGWSEALMLCECVDNAAKWLREQAE